MTPLRPGKLNLENEVEFNPRIEKARAIKVEKLVKVIDMNFTMATGESPYGANAGIIARGMTEWTSDDWRALAREAKVNEPSQATVDAVQAVYETRAQFNPRPVVGPVLEVVR
jgi:hypothetical protein